MEESQRAAVLHELVKVDGTPQALTFRARIVLACAAGRHDTQVAAQEHTPPTVGLWRKRFSNAGDPRGCAMVNGPDACANVADKKIEMGALCRGATATGPDALENAA